MLLTIFFLMPWDEEFDATEIRKDWFYKGSGKSEQEIPSVDEAF